MKDFTRGGDDVMGDGLDTSNFCRHVSDVFCEKCQRLRQLGVKGWIHYDAYETTRSKKCVNSCQSLKN